MRLNRWIAALVLLACAPLVAAEDALDHLRAEYQALVAAQRDFAARSASLPAAESQDYAAYIDRLRRRRCIGALIKIFSRTLAYSKGVSAAGRLASRRSPRTHFIEVPTAERAHCADVDHGHVYDAKQCRPHVTGETS